MAVTINNELTLRPETLRTLAKTFCTFQKFSQFSFFTVVRLLVQFENDQFSSSSVLVIFPIAIAYSMGQIIKPAYMSVCPSACTLTLAFLDRFSHFTKIGTDVKIPKSKNKFVGGKHRTTPSPILPHKLPI